jgi:hypothetical protein
MTRNLFESIMDCTDRALVGISAVEARLKGVVPELKRLQPVLDKNATKLEAVYLTLQEVNGLVRDIKSEIEAGSGHLAENAGSLDSLVDELTTQREGMARLATITRHVHFFLEDPNTLKEIIWQVIQARPELKAIIRGWFDGN